jgi:DNA mismatch repair protein MutS2
MEDQLQHIIRDTKNKKEASIKEAQRSIREVKVKWQSHLPTPVEKIQPIEGLKEGQTVKLAHFNQKGVVLKVDQSLHKAEIMVGGMKVKVGFDAIEHITEKNDLTETDSPAESFAARDHYLSALEEDTVSHRVNVIGMTVDEALPIVDRTIDHALIRGLDTIEIIHGLGTGRLKEAIRKHLKVHSYVKQFGSDEQSRGGAGVTQVEIQANPEGPSKKMHRTS